MKRAMLGWKRQQKKLLLIFLCSVGIFLWGLLTTPNLQAKSMALLENKSHFGTLKNIIEIARDQIDLRKVKEIFEVSSNEERIDSRYSGRKSNKIIWESKRMNKSTIEKRIFLRKNLDVIVSMQSRNVSTWEGVYCSGNLYNFKGIFVLLKDVVIDPTRKESKAVGGEKIESVIGHSAKDEEVHLQAGFFTLPCKEIPKIIFPTNSYFKNWMSGISKSDWRKKDRMDANLDEFNFTVLIQRGDYANLYWTLIELFNTYLTIRLFNENPKFANVIIMDAHPAGKLDDLWKVMFGNVCRVGQMSNKTRHKNLAWVIQNGPMQLSVQTIPFVNEFKLALYEGVQNSSISNNECSRVPNVTFILRKDYVAHPRNPSGRIQRKLINEKEVIEYLTKNIPQANINAIQIDLMPIKEQIKLIYNTNVLVGVHGAGLAYALLLRSGSTVIELFPSSYKRSPNPHFQQFAYWADVHYDRWYSSAPPQKQNEWLYVNPEVPYTLIKRALERSCKH